MLQFIPQNSNNQYSIEEQCQMFIEGGGGWILLRTDSLSDDRIRELSAELIPLCKETSTILTIENQPELAEDLGVHGIFLTSESGKSAPVIREKFGAEAIIGVEVGSSQAILCLKGRDIDYVSLKPDLSFEQAREIIKEANEAGNEMPVVLTGNFGIEDVDDILATGALGVATGDKIVSDSDPVKYTEEFIKRLNKSKKQ